MRAHALSGRDEDGRRREVAYKEKEGEAVEYDDAVRTGYICRCCPEYAGADGMQEQERSGRERFDEYGSPLSRRVRGPTTQGGYTRGGYERVDTEELQTKTDTTGATGKRDTGCTTHTGGLSR